MEAIQSTFGGSRYDYPLVGGIIGLVSGLFAGIAFTCLGNRLYAIPAIVCGAFLLIVGAVALDPHRYKDLMTGLALGGLLTNILLMAGFASLIEDKSYWLWLGIYQAFVLVLSLAMFTSRDFWSKLWEVIRLPKVFMMIAITFYLMAVVMGAVSFPDPSGHLSAAAFAAVGVWIFTLLLANYDWWHPVSLLAIGLIDAFLVVFSIAKLVIGLVAAF